MDSDVMSVPATQYYPISTRKFIVLGFLTFGLFELYWFWKNWQFIKNRDGSNILPWGRAVFAVIWYPFLLKDLNTSSESGRRFGGGVFLLAASYFLLHSFSGLPDPLFLIAFASFLPMLPAVREINQRNSLRNDDYRRNSSWRIRHAVLALVTVPLLAYTIASSTMLIPSADIVPGWALVGRAQSFLQKNVLEGNEDVLYFYAGGFFSFSEDGNLLTKSRVVSYWEDIETGDFYLESAAFSEIADVDVVDGSWIDDSVITVHCHDGTSFDLFLPGNDKRNRQFVEKLNNYVRTHAAAEVPAPNVFGQ